MVWNVRNVTTNPLSSAAAEEPGRSAICLVEKFLSKEENIFYNRLRLVRIVILKRIFSEPFGVEENRSLKVPLGI